MQGLILPLVQLVPQGVCTGSTPQLLVMISSSLQPLPVAVAAKLQVTHGEEVVAPDTPPGLPTSTVVVDSHNSASEPDLQVDNSLAGNKRQIEAAPPAKKKRSRNKS